MNGMCEVCGCTDDDPCVDEATGETCCWAGPDLCSFCAHLTDVGPLIVPATDYQAQRFIDELRRARGAS